MSKNVFSDLIVLDHTRYLLGGYATQVFADLGAEVIKVEEIKRGDLCRDDFPFRNGVSYYHTALNRNKKSLTLNFKSEAGREAYFKLVKDADIVIENFRPGVTKRLSIDYETVKAINPRIIHCSLTSFGQDDPRSLGALHDINFQALSGYLALNGGKTSPVHLCDLAAGMVAAQSILAALLQRTVTGEGTFCDVRMFDSFVWWNSLLDSRYELDGFQISADSIEFPALAYNIYETKDGGKISIGMLEDKFWHDFCQSHDLADIMPFKLNRRHEAPDAFARMEAHFKTKTFAEWKEWLETQDICAMPIIGKAEAIDYILSSGTGLMEHLDFPLTGKTLQTNIPHGIASLPVSLKNVTPAPALGEHNADILKKLGYTDKQIEEMAAKGECGPII